ncbi:MAG: hypothetical protein U0232_09240 [Thermomicrobiales bacterium]
MVVSIRLCITTRTQICHELLGRSVTIIVQGPIQIGPDYEPQPDLIIARPRTDNYREDNPTPEDILAFLIEAPMACLRMIKR